VRRYDDGCSGLKYWVEWARAAERSDGRSIGNRLLEVMADRLRRKPLTEEEMRQWVLGLTGSGQ
jgi:hypothetical protein